MNFALRCFMVNALYLFLIIIVTLWSVAYGFRKGVTGQLAHLLGFAFGAVGSRVLAPQFYEHFLWISNLSQAPEFREMTVDLVCAVIIYSVIFAFFSLITPLMHKLMAVVRVGMLNRIGGAFFALLKNLLWLSIAFNLLLCLSPKSRLLSYMKANDGNSIAAVMSLTPAILGCYGAEDFAHINQLKEAKLISANFQNSDPSIYVILS